MLTRSNLRKLALLRLKESKRLLDAKCYPGAYYLAGYSVECALKACIAKKTKRGEFPDKAVVTASHTHNLEKLIGSAGLDIQLKSKIESDKSFVPKWSTVKDWSEKSRYEIRSKKEAEDLLTAISDPNGVLIWIQQYW